MKKENLREKETYMLTYSSPSRQKGVYGVAIAKISLKIIDSFCRTSPMLL